MKKTMVITISALILLVGATFSPAQKTAQTEVRVKPNSVEFKGLKARDISEVRRILNATVSRTVNELSAGDVTKAKKDCARVDLTNQQVCIEITIEPIPEPKPKQ